MRVITGTSNDNVNTVGDVCVFDTDMNECENVQYYITPRMMSRQDILFFVL